MFEGNSASCCEVQVGPENLLVCSITSTKCPRLAESSADLEAIRYFTCSELGKFIPPVSCATKDAILLDTYRKDLAFELGPPGRIMIVPDNGPDIIS